MSVDVSVIISNRNDTAMLALTARSALEEMKALPNGGEVIIVDNSDPEIYEGLKKGAFFAKRYMDEGKIRLFRQNKPCLFTARATAIQHSLGKYIACLDGHMLVGHNMLLDLFNFMEQSDPDTGFAHAPISWLHQHEAAAKHDRRIEKHELGPWGAAYQEARTITWKGMPWMCHKWLWRAIGGYGALARHRISWGGGDMFIGTKPWLLGFKNWAVPTSPGIHIGPFPKEYTKHHPYRLYSQSGQQTTTVGFLIAAYVLGGEDMMKRIGPTLKERFKLDVAGHWDKAIELGTDERKWLLDRQKMSYQEYLDTRPWNAN